MEKMYLPIFYQLGHQLKPITQYEYNVSKRVPLVSLSIPANTTTKNILANYPALTVCRSAGNEFSKSSDEILNWLVQTKTEDLGKRDYNVDKLFQGIINNAKEFETVLLAELQTLATYHATQKGIYSTIDLIERAEYMFPEAILSKLSKATINELRQSGRCLAFDSATSSAFHILRATELVMHQYYINVCKPKPKPKKRLSNWGVYIIKFSESKNPDVKEVLSILQQIKDRHRNLIMHPDAVLKPDEAFTLFEIAQGAIIAMASALP